MDVSVEVNTRLTVAVAALGGQSHSDGDAVLPADGRDGTRRAGGAATSGDAETEVGDSSVEAIR